MIKWGIINLDLSKIGRRCRIAGKKEIRLFLSYIGIEYI